MHHGIFKPILFDIFCHYIGNGLDFIYCNCNYHIDDLRKLLGDEFVVTLSSFKEPEPYSGEIRKAR